MNMEQELINKEDIFALIEGDRVWVELAKHNGQITFLKEDEGTLYFIRRHDREVLEYLVEETNVKIENGGIVQKQNYPGRGKPTQHKKNSDQYEIYNKIISQN